MANTVFNKIYVTGTASQIENFRKEVATQETHLTRTYPNMYPIREFDFNSIIPIGYRYPVVSASHLENYPGLNDALLKNDIEKCLTFTSRMDMAIQLWGCKWNAGNVEMELTDENTKHNLQTILISFETPWSPPLSVFKEMVLRYPNMIFSYSWQEETEDETWVASTVCAGQHVRLMIIRNGNEDNNTIEEPSDMHMILDESPFILLKDESMILVEQYWNYLRNVDSGINQPTNTDDNSPISK